MYLVVDIVLGMGIFVLECSKIYLVFGIVSMLDLLFMDLVSNGWIYIFFVWFFC